MDTNAIKQCSLGYNNLIISWMLITSAILSKLKKSLKQEIGFGHQDVIHHKPAQVVTMIMKQDQENKQGSMNDK